jgi:hypothetical protein
MIWGLLNEHQTMQKRFYCNALNAYRNWRDPQRSERKANQVAVGLTMEVARCDKSTRFTAFQATAFSYAHWDVAKEKMVSVEHRGYVADAESFEQAAQQLISMVRPMHYDLGERMMDSVKNFGVKAR